MAKLNSTDLCVFCGEPLAGKKTNFEHVVPKWLVAEADLKKRQMEVDLSNRKFKAAMNRIGAWACERCNSERSTLEANAKAVYEKLRDGEALTQQDGRTLLDWLDKIRVGLWLWLNNSHPARERLSPNFHINERMATRDRIAFVAKYDPKLTGKGLLFFGVDKAFHWQPSVVGFMANNLVFYSMSSYLLLLRHIRNIQVKGYVSADATIAADISLDLNRGPSIQLLGNPLAIGQCIFDEETFQTASLPMKTIGIKSKLGESEVMKLSSELKQIPGSIGSLEVNKQHSAKNLALLEINGARTTELLLNHFLSSDFVDHDTELKTSVQSYARKMLALKKNQIVRLRDYYRRLTGLSIP